MIHSIYDNGGKTIDRYTVIFDVPVTTIPDEPYYCALAMDDKPFHPQGFCLHVEALPGLISLGKRIELKQLPKDCQKVVELELLEYANN